MKRTVFILLLITVHLAVTAQTTQFRAKLYRPDEPVYLTLDYVSATIQGYDGDEIIIEAVPAQVTDPPAASGLKSLSIPGREKEDNIMRPRLQTDPTSLRITIPPGNFRHLAIRVPKSIVLFVKAAMNLNDGKISISNINSIDIQGTLSNIEISKVTNFVVIGGGKYVGSRATGKVMISDVTWTDAPVMVNGNPTHRTYIVNSTNSDIELSIPQTAKADFIFASEFGDVYSNLNINPTPPLSEDLNYIKGFFKLKPSTKTIVSNGGGVNVFVDSMYGNIYLKRE